MYVPNVCTFSYHVSNVSDEIIDTSPLLILDVVCRQWSHKDFCPFQDVNQLVIDLAPVIRAHHGLYASFIKKIVNLR